MPWLTGLFARYRDEIEARKSQPMWLAEALEHDRLHGDPHCECSERGE